MTAIPSRDIARFLGGDWRSYPVILVHGSDDGAVRDTVAALLAAAAGPDPDPMNLIVLDGESVAQDPPRLADELRTYGLFGGRRVIHLRGAARAPVSVIEAAASDPAPETLLVMEAIDIGSKAPLPVLAGRHRAIAALACYADNAKALGTLIDQRLAADQLRITPDARALLLSLLGADRALSRSEIDKLALYALGSHEITTTMVGEIIADAGRHDASDLIDAALCGQIAAVEPEANRLFMAGLHPSALLAQTIGHLCALRRTRLSGGSAATFKDKGRLHFSREAAVNRALSLWTVPRLERAIQQASETTLLTRRTARLAEALTIRLFWSLARSVEPRSRAG